MTTLDQQFIAEGRDLLQQIGDGFLALERAPGDGETVRGIFRAVHTLKGASGIFEALRPLTQVVHAGEDVLDRVRDGDLALTPDIADDFLESFDQVAAWLDAYEDDGRLASDADRIAEDIAARLRALVPTATDGEADSDTAADDDAGPAWLADIDDGALAARASFAVTYRPDPQVFFQGDDPLLTVRTLPDLLWLDILPIAPWGPLAETDPFAANLEFRLLTGADRATVDEHFRYVASQVALHALPGDGPVVPLAAETALPPLTAAVVRELEEGLAVPGPAAVAAGRIASSGRILRALGLEDPAVLAALRRAAEATDPALLGQVLAALLAQTPVPEDEDTAEPGDGAAFRPAAPAAQEKPVETARRSPSIKIDQARMDDLMDMIGELVVVKNGLPFLARRAEEVYGDKRLSREIRSQYESLNRVTNAIQGSVMRMRMVPVGTVFTRFNRLVRDIARKLGKDIDLVLIGEDTEADKTVVEELADPLVHLIRNACDHGLETPEARRMAGKAPRGTLTLAARSEDDQVLIEITDDGHGIDAAAIKRKALEKGLIDEDRAAALSDREAVNLILLPGFSTAEAISDLSGRGVGMDVVKSMVERRGGRLEIVSAVGQGTTVRLAVPLSMALTRIMLFDVGGQQFGIPIAAIVETRRVRPDDIHKVKDQECIVLRDRVVTLKRLATALGLSRTASDTAAVVTDPAVLVLNIDGQQTALVVDRFHEGIDLVVKPMEGVLAAFPMYSGTALLGDGRVLPIFNARELIQCL